MPHTHGSPAAEGHGAPEGPGSTEGSGPAPGSHPVVIAGAGPTGLLLAGDLAAAGVDVVVVEKRPEGISNLTRAFGVHARTLELLDARGLADELVATGQMIRELRLFGAIPFDIGALPSRFPFLLVTPQYEVEKLLLRRATENGAVIRYGTEVLGLTQDDEAVTVSVRTEAGEGTLRASYLVGADGARSAVREALGLPFPGKVVIRSVALADVRFTEQPSLVVRVHGTGDAFGFIAPFGDGYWRVGGWDRAHRGRPDDAPVEFEELRSLIERAFGSDFGMHDPRWLSRFHSDERQVPRYRVGRVLLAGDSAHQHSPAGGQGMNTGLQDAVNLGWKLAAVLGGRASGALLDTYHSERHPVGRAVLRSSGLNLRLAMAHNPLEVALRTVRKLVVTHVRPVARQAVGEITGIGYSYPAPRGAHALVGKRAPDLELDGGRLYERLREGRFVLVLPAGASGEPGRGTGFDTDARRERVVVARRTGGGGRGAREAVLVRPDGYYAWAGAADGPAVEAGLAPWLG
ncbi:2-polyprenyl-6-methoxyphenol hydroxylase-like FAD-dependent oxidoreductase [Streptomyces sp. 840.1]|uniref:FAD-dependent oxidoreductase n=1 Tax=Streptomyces sp. 840.1 TaxID=2485152 RepID=UPI000F4834D2|nr:FAD-dependent oxidoreductase [Streptomyces sp. 840.1]ROQ66595.1 2-polyprenyl-6-methoxyphenol hydroxylase-like FAD-dependent oxidoreductase [Streptomyces sp. 840.1]